jgi:hypothetical protein
MSKFSSIILLLLGLLPALVHAEWIKVGTANNVSLYLDPSKTAIVDGTTKRGVILLSFNGKQQVDKGSAYLSVVSRIEADCRQMSYKTISNFYYAGQMGQGEAVGASNIPPPEQEVGRPAPNSVLDEVLTQICSRAKP